MRWKGHRATISTIAAATAFPFTHPHVNHFICLARLASTSPSSPSSTPFPFPAHRNPTPHQIFHLPPNPSQAEIKARCTSTSVSPPKEPPQLLTSDADYELARTFHPDSPASQALPSSVRHARFHAVARAYDTLRGKSHARLGQGPADDVYTAESARRRRQHAWRQAYDGRGAAPGYAEAASGADDAWKDQVIIVVGLAVRTVSISSSFFSCCDSPVPTPVVDRGGLCPCVALVACYSRCAASRCVRQPCAGTSRSTDVRRRATRCDSRSRRQV